MRLIRRVFHAGRRGCTTAQLVLASCIVGLGFLAFVPTAAADSSDVLTPTAEAWYQPNPSCTLPPECVAPPGQPPVTSVYPARTMHVGFSGWQETARSYLALPLAGATGTITAASLTVPLDTATADGSRSPEQAKIQVCTTSDKISSVDGSFDTPPKTDCSSPATALFVATPEAHLEVDLAPLSSGLSSATGLVLLPDVNKATTTDTWRVVFSAHDRADAAKTAPATVTLTVADEAQEFPSSEDVLLPAEDRGNPAFGAVRPPVGTGFARAPVAEVRPTQTVVSQISNNDGYAYPVVWLAPLAFVLLVPMTVGALKRDLTPLSSRRSD